LDLTNNWQSVSSNHLQPVLVLIPKNRCPLCSGGLTGLCGGLTDLRGDLIAPGGGLTGLGGGHTVRLCIEQIFLASGHQFCFNMKILALYIITRCSLR
jgi:hypothetical protein